MLRNLKPAIFFNSGNEKLQIILYQDAFNVCNPLGQYRNTKKMVGVYFAVGNIPSYDRSNINNIQLVLLCNEKDVKYFSFNKILQPLIHDVLELENKGVSICFNNETSLVKGSLFAVTGDNLGSHQIACLPENFSSAEYICRFCYIRNVEFQENYKKRHQFRTQVSHISDLESIQRYDCSSHGLKSDSVLNSLNHFHTQGPGLPPCIAHDLFEGILNFDLSLILQKMISNKWFSLNQLNATIKSSFKIFNIKDSNELGNFKEGGENKL